MIVVEEDDGCLHVYASLDAVVLAVEALDAEEVLRAVFDEHGQPYRIEWIKPNDKSLWGLSNGVYGLVPDGPPNPAALLALIRAHPAGQGADALRALETRLAKWE
jgi:hypothetical protein